MAWQRSLQSAIRSLRKEERNILKNLSSVRDRISELESLSKRPANGRRRATDSARPRRPRRLSAAGRAAISRAAKARLERECVVVGNHHTVEIWDEQAWQEYLRAQDDQFADLSEEVVPGLF